MDSSVLGVRSIGRSKRGMLQTAAAYRGGNVTYDALLSKRSFQIAPSNSRDAARAVIRSWRRLTGGRAVRDQERRTLIGCSGGADSSALLLALASATSSLVAAHVVHDLRPPDQADADCRAVAELAARLEIPFVWERVRVKSGRGNAEKRARMARYAALNRLASEAGCPFVAVGHHQDDQAETVVMGLLRGAGPTGLAGVAESRALGHAVLIRPMLGLSRTECQGLCRLAGWAWREDTMNADEDLFRGAVRHGLLPAAERLRPGASARMARTAALLRDAANLIADRASILWGLGTCDDAGNVTWDRSALRGERAVVVGAFIRLAAWRLHVGKGLDRLGSRTLDEIVRALRDSEGRPRQFSVGRLLIEVRSKSVRFQGVGSDG